MATRRRGGAIALWLTLGLSACHHGTSSTPGGGTPNLDAAVFQACDSVCIRPSDCAQAFNDDGICPPGFLCALRFRCGSD